MLPMATTLADVTLRPNTLQTILANNLTPTLRNADEGQDPHHAQIVTNNPANPLTDMIALTNVDAAPSDQATTLAQEMHAPLHLPPLAMLPKLTNPAPIPLVTNTLPSLTYTPRQAQSKATQAPP